MAHITDIPYIDNTNIDYLISCLNTELVRKYQNNISGFDILVVGGAALALKYAYRSTVDIDADIRFQREITSSINNVAKLNNIPTDWINQDFMKSASYSRNLWMHAIPYKSFGYINTYIVNDLDQLCMKAVSGRVKDVPDIVFLCDKVMNMGIRYSDFIIEFKFLYSDVVAQNERAKKRIYKEFKRKHML